MWDLKSMKCIFTFASGSEVYSLAMTNNTVYGGCFDHKIRVWNLNTMQKSHMLIGHEVCRRLPSSESPLGYMSSAWLRHRAWCAA